MERKQVIGGLVVLVIWGVFVFAIPDDTTNKVIGGYWLLLAAGLILIPLASAAFSGVGWALRRRNARRNLIEPSLRQLVLTDESWENCAQSPDFATEVLLAYAFLVESEGFNPATMDRNRNVITFRRADSAIHVANVWLDVFDQSDDSDDWVYSEATLQVDLLRSPDSFAPIASVTFGSHTNNLGDGHRGVAFHLQSHLESILDELRKVSETSSQQTSTS